MRTRPPSTVRPHRRPGYTLLEVLLASAIAVMLLAALYVAVDVQVGHAQSGREVVEQAALSRTLMKRMSTDINSAIALSDPARWRMANQKGGSGGGMGGGAAAGGAAGAAAPTTDPSATGGSTSSSGTSAINGTTTSVAPNPNTVGIPLGIQGDTNQINIYISRTPREALLNPNQPNAASTGNAGPNGQNGGPANAANGLPMNTSTTNGVAIPIVGDIRRVTYWLVGGEGSPQGLARMEVKLPTSDDAANLLPPNVDNESAYIIAEEVRSLNFQYYDGTQWNDTWDSTTLGADGITPIGSPVAVAVTIGLARGEGPNAPVKTFRQVIAISTANGTTPQSTTTQGQTTTP
jgi:prepilin-type N-terminal cleavage/methylation domain-containing protein